jgi:hypothetical protein
MSTNSTDKNMKTATIELLTSGSSYVLEVNMISFTNTDNIIVKPILDTTKKEILLCIDESFQCTWLNLTGTAPVTILFFDDHYEFVGITHFSKKSKGSYVISTAYKNILVLNNPYAYDFKQIIQLKNI